MPFLGVFGHAWDDAMGARWSANPLGMLLPEVDAGFVTSGGNGGGPAGAPRRKSGHARWTAAEIAERLAVLGLPERMPLSVLAVELLPEPNGTFADPLGGDLGEVRILCTSPLIAVDKECC